MTPYVLIGPTYCNEANSVNSRFVHAVVVNNVTGDMFVYNPLVITQGSPLAATPTPVNFTSGDSVVGIWMTSNSPNLLFYNSSGVMNGRCVSGTSGSPFGSFAFCNVDRFWMTVNTLVQQGKITLPPLEFAVDGLPCPTLYDFLIAGPGVDIPTTYLVTNLNAVIQKTQNNMKMFNIKQEISNGWGNLRLLSFLNPAIRCTNLLVPDASDPGILTTALPLNILQALILQRPPMALIPSNDPNVITNNLTDLVKLNLYRIALDQPVSTVIGGDNDPATYCRNFAQVATARLKSLSPQLKAYLSPDPGEPNLFSFMINRESKIYADYNCQMLTGLPDPFTALN
jgi:hypothetical protein